MAGILLLEQSGHMLSQFMDGVAGSIHDVVGNEPNRREHIPLARDQVQNGKVRIQRMGPACLAETSNQNGVGSFEKPQLGLNAGPSLELLKDLRKVLKIFAFTHVDDNRCLGSFVGLQNEFVKFSE